MATAQRDLTAAAVNAEWVKWGEEDCPHEPVDNDVHTPKRLCRICWQERKKEKGL